MRRSYRVTDIVCGDNYITTRVYPEYTPPARSRKRRSAPTSEVQQLLNDKNRKEHLRHLAATNFTKKDYYVTLTYRDSALPESFKKAERELRNYLKRVKTKHSRRGFAAPKAIGVTGYGSKRKRLHHHLIISGDLLPYELIELWKGRGFVTVNPLQFDQFGIAVDNLMSYFEKHVEENKRSGIKCAYYRSRNLAEPKVYSRSKRLSHKQIEFARTFTDFTAFERLHPQYTLCDLVVFHNDVNGGYYFTLRYFKPPRKRK